MSESRPAVPAALKRKLEEEAGYRCAVPTCRGTSALQMEHIEEWSKVKEHRFENMIILCATCHSRVTGKEISKEAIKAYKRNLAIVSGRYSLFEMRLLEAFHGQTSHGQPPHLPISEIDWLHVKGLIDDGLIEVHQNPNIQVYSQGFSDNKLVLVPSKQGAEFVRQFFSGVPLP
ncbi:HNH endonuclease [Sulfitobacter pontiacus]|uniref:HNH endonuclease n=1 Tax=Sulfitobacter pontiacus TaxID=60137 RepID=UPI003266EC83